MKPYRNLVVGDPHSTPEELDDCRALMKLVYETAGKYDVDVITVMGDLHNNHDTVSTRCTEFWLSWLRMVGRKVFFIRGNHDQVSPSEAYPHALLPYTSLANVVADPGLGPAPNSVAMPYYYDPAEFLSDSRLLRKVYPEAHTLFCHQTFDGSRYENGFYARDAVNPSEVPFEHIISGHIHMPQAFGNVLYVGAPRWRITSDAGQDRHLWVLEHVRGGGGYQVVEKVPTDTVCSRIYTFDDTPAAPADLASIPEDARARSRIRVDVYGPDSEYVRKREAALKMEYGARTRGFPDRQKRVQVSEAMGIDKAFGQYADRFRAPHGTASPVLRQAVEERLGTAG